MITKQLTIWCDKCGDWKQLSTNTATSLRDKILCFKDLCEAEDDTRHYFSFMLDAAVETKDKKKALLFLDVVKKAMSSDPSNGIHAWGHTVGTRIFDRMLAAERVLNKDKL